MKAGEQRIPSIDLFRYVCGVLVIAIHTRPMEEISQNLGYITSDVLPRIAVPFFFAVSGFFYFQNLMSGKKPFRRTFSRLLLTYTVWSCLYYFIDFIQWGHENLRGFLSNCLLGFLTYGSYYHFWFFPALLFSLCLSELLWKLKARRALVPMSILLYLIGCMGCSYYNICRSIPILGALFSYSGFETIRRILLMGFPFFVSGYLILQVKDRLAKRILRVWTGSMIAWILEIALVVHMHLQRSIVLTAALYSLVVSTIILLLRTKAEKLSPYSETSRRLANYTYYVHPVFILVLSSAYHTVLGEVIPNTMLFLMTVLGTFLSGTFLIRMKYPFIQNLIS